jgi:hypothetical protein
LELVLTANGVEFDKLSQYVSHDIYRYGIKLSDLKRRLESALKTLGEDSGVGAFDDDVNMEDAHDELIRYIFLFFPLL